MVKFIEVIFIKNNEKKCEQCNTAEYGVPYSKEGYLVCLLCTQQLNIQRRSK